MTDENTYGEVLALRSEGFRERRVVSVRYLVTPTDSWPAHTNEYCRWDLRPIDGEPYGIPHRWASDVHKMEMVGFWCSPACALAWIKTHSRTVHVLRHFLAMMRIVYNVTDVKAAPPREMLAHMSLEDFRSFGTRTGMVVNPLRHNALCIGERGEFLSATGVADSAPVPVQRGPLYTAPSRKSKRAKFESTGSALDMLLG